MLPMGTIMAACMFLGVIFGFNLPVLNKLPGVIKKCVAIIVLAAGVWNVFWYALQHITEFWGFAALISGLLMIITALYLLDFQKLPQVLVKFKPLVLVVLLGYALMYAITIARL